MAPGYFERYDDRMADILSPEKIFAREKTLAAQRIINDGNAGAFLASGNGNDFLRRSDTELIRFNEKNSKLAPYYELKTRKFLRNVREEVREYLDHDPRCNHFLIKKIPQGEKTSLFNEAKYWDIKAPEGVELESRSANALFIITRLFENLPPEAHRLRYPLLMDGALRGHCVRVGIYNALLAQRLNEVKDEPVADPALAAIGGYLHDIGKNRDDIFKAVMHSGKLNPEQWGLVKIHPRVGADTLQALYENKHTPLDQESFDEIYNAALRHHVRPDGKGYPSDVNYAENTLLAKMIAIADSYDAMTSYRPHQVNKTHEQATEEILRCSGTQFDPELAHIFIGLGVSSVFVPRQRTFEITSGALTDFQDAIKNDSRFKEGMLNKT